MNTAVQQQTESNGQSIITPNERRLVMDKLATKWPTEILTNIEKQAYERSNGIRSHYIKLVQTYLQNHQNSLSRQNRATQQLQPQLINTNARFQNPQTNISEQSTVTLVNHLQHPINQMPNQPSQFSMLLQPTRMSNPQSTALNPMIASREPQKFNQTLTNTSSYLQSSATGTAAATVVIPSSTATVDLSQNYASRQIINTNQTDFSAMQPRYPAQTTSNAPRQRTTISNANFQQASSNKSNDVLNQVFIVNTPSMGISSSTTAMPTAATTLNTSSSSTGDPLLQRILLSNTDGGVNATSSQNRPIISANRPQIARSTTAPISNPSSTVNPIRSSLPSQQVSSSPSLVILPTATQSSTIHVQPSNNMIIQPSSTNNSVNNNNNNNGTLSSNSQTTTMNSTTSIYNNYLSPANRSLTSTNTGNISSPDNETLNLIKYLKENVNRLQLLCQKFTNDGNTEKLRQVQVAQQQIINFVNNPTYEGLPNAKRLRDVLEQITNRLQQANNASATSLIATSTTTSSAAITTTTTVIAGTSASASASASAIASASASATTSASASTATTITTATATATTSVVATATTNSQTHVFNQCLKATKEFLSRDQKDRINITKRCLEPLIDVINGVPHKIMRLDGDNTSTIKVRSCHQSSLLSTLNDEMNQLPDDIYSIERVSVSHTRKSSDDTGEEEDERLSKSGIILRCKLLEKARPLIPPLRLHLTTYYPEQPPEILSLTKTMPPRLEFTDGHPFFDQVSSMFVSHLFKLNPQHTVTDILNIWRQSVQAAL